MQMLYRIISDRSGRRRHHSCAERGGPARATQKRTSMADRPSLTTEAGAPVIDTQHSQTAGPSGPVLLQDHYLIEKLARFNRERIPERIVHAVGSAAYGYLEVTSAEVPRWTKMKVFSQVGKRTRTFLRVSTVAGSRGAAAPGPGPRRPAATGPRGGEA